MREVGGGSMAGQDRWERFYGPNAGYVLELYERYQADPASVDAATRAFFEQSSLDSGANGAAAPVAVVTPTRNGAAAAQVAPPPAITEHRDNGAGGPFAAAPLGVSVSATEPFTAADLSLIHI